MPLNSSLAIAQNSTQSKIIIELVTGLEQIDKSASSSILVESFMGEYKKYMSPQDVDANLNSWHDGENSVKKYYQKYFESELKEFADQHLDFWVQAKIDGKLAGWATFQREGAEGNDAYMNLLVVDPAYQGLGVGKQLVHSLINLELMPNLKEIHLLIRKKNIGGSEFYKKLGFFLDLEYKRDNFVDVTLLQGLTWKNSDFK